jgi:hypothetical protein
LNGYQSPAVIEQPQHEKRVQSLAKRKEKKDIVGDAFCLAVNGAGKDH